MDNKKNSSNNHLLPLQEKWIFLSTVEAQRLFIYYLVIIITSLIWFIGSLLWNYVYSQNSFPIIIGIIMFALPSSLIGACIYYVRKLYKSCIQGLVTEPSTEFEKAIQAFGAKMYFYSRPPISAILALYAILGIYVGFFVLQSQPVIENDKFFIICSLIAFYIGFCNGKIIVDLDNQGDRFVKMFSRRDNGDVK